MKGESDREIVIALLDFSMGIDDPPARLEFLRKACAGDEPMLTRIMGLLDAQKEAEEFFQTATIAKAEVVGGVLGDLTDEAPRGELPESPDADGPGSQIGRYVLLERIGEGGCGVVYLAEQCEPVRRKVALKIIRRGLDTESVIARFETERQSLALMEHPNIARAFDAGSTANGRPFFVMELVHGEKITAHCDAARLGIKERLELFIQVCNAIQHAHQKGVIHRDIKPSNILVTMQDGQAAPKVIDFGIAKAVERQFPHETRITNHALLIGTPAYMSPEQAEGSPSLDTRGDIYSLGALLYELLTGRPPFDGKDLAQVGMLEMLRILREEEPLAPSAILTGLDAFDLTMVAASRNTEPKSLFMLIRGDLDGIVLKALAKDPQARYSSAADVAADVRRHLNDEPVCARPPGQVYLFTKLVRRHKLAFAAAMLILLALIAGGVVSNWFYLKERDARKMAEAARRAADDARKIAEAARASEAHLLNQSKAREKISKASVLLAENKFDEADALLFNTPFSSIEPTTEALHVFRSYGDWNAIRQRWDQAAECYDYFSKAKGFGRMPFSEVSWILLSVGVIQVESRRMKAYEEFQNLVIAQYGKASSYQFCGIVLKSCLLAPTKPHVTEQLQAVEQRVERKLKWNTPETIDRERDSDAAVSMALMQFRKGNFAGAQNWARESLNYIMSSKARIAIAHAIGAMAAWKLGQTEVADSELAKAREQSGLIAGPDPLSFQSQGQGLWQNDAIARILLREAESTVK